MRRIFITKTDQDRLSSLVAELRKKESDVERLDAIEQELARAEIVEQSEVPGDVITMNSTAVLRDLDSEQTAEYTLVYPWEANISKGKISVMAPIGIAMLGYQVGDTVEWEVPQGIKRYKVERVLFQPEREGLFDL